MGDVSRQLGILGLLGLVSTPANNPVRPEGAGAWVEPDWNPHHISVDADQSQTATMTADVEFESPVDKSHFT